MRRLIPLLSALLLLGATAAPAQDAFPDKIALPNGFAPEGIEIGKEHTFYVGSVGSGAVYVGDLRTGAGRILVAGAPGVRSATGLELERDRLWVAGARFGNAYIYNAKTGALLQQLQLATGTDATFINDVVVDSPGVLSSPTRSARCSTRSGSPGSPHPARSRRSRSPATTSTSPGQFNLNGIVATPRTATR